MTTTVARLAPSFELCAPTSSAAAHLWSALIRRRVDSLPGWTRLITTPANENLAQVGRSTVAAVPQALASTHDSHGGKSEACGRASSIDVQSALDAPSGAAGGKGRDAIRANGYGP
jgi:hypothetical protein